MRMFTARLSIANRQYRAPRHHSVDGDSQSAGVRFIAEERCVCTATEDDVYLLRPGCDTLWGDNA